jgi:hypothetical protein
MTRVRLAFAVLLGFLATTAPQAHAAPPSKPDPDPRSLEVPPEELSKARELVQKLGSEAFHERETAERDLAAMGRLARAAILDGVNLDPDPEIRARCRTLLPKATAEEMKARLETFLADSEGKYEHDLPGWHKLRATVRGEWTMFGWTFTARPDADKAARELFIDFMKAPGGRQLLTAVDGTPQELGGMVATRKTEMYQALYPRGGRVPARVPTATEVGVVVFAESQVHSRHVPRAMALSTVMTRSGIQNTVQGNSNRAIAMQAVMNAWFDSRTDAAELYTAFTLASSMRNNDAIGRLAGRIMSTPGVQGFYKGQVLTTMVRLKMTDQVANIEKAFTDNTVLTTTIKVVNGMQVRQTIEVRDAALAAALVLTGQSPQDYGFDSFPKNVGTSFSYVWAKIPDEKRKDAVEKWKTWREKNP